MENSNSKQETKTIISETMVVVGNVKSSDDLQILGMVKGSVETTKQLLIKGKVQGDVKGKDIVLENCTIQGNVSANKDIDINDESVIIGDISADNICSAGKIKGNLVVQELVKLEGEAIVNGDVTAARIMMGQGVKFNGKVSIISQDLGDDNNFDVKFDI